LGAHAWPQGLYAFCPQAHLQGRHELPSGLAITLLGIQPLKAREVPHLHAKAISHKYQRTTVKSQGNCVQDPSLECPCFTPMGSASEDLLYFSCHSMRQSFCVLNQALEHLCNQLQFQPFIHKISGKHIHERLLCKLPGAACPL